MIDILIGLVIILGVAVGLLFIYIGELRKEVKEISSIQRVQDEDIYELMKTDYDTKSILSEHSEIITYLAEQDSLIGKKKNIYTGIIGEA
jgi:hypothetical protein